MSDGYERRRQEFRRRILDAVEDLVREHNGVGFVIRDVADRAGVSPATPFNHFRTKTGMLLALMDRSLSEIARNSPVFSENDDAIDFMIRSATHAARSYAEQSELYRPVFRAVLFATAGDGDSVIDRAVRMWRRSLERAEHAGQLNPAVDVDMLANLLETNWLGALIPWMAGSIDGSELRLRVEYGTALILAGTTTDSVSRDLLKRARGLDIGGAVAV